MTDGHAWLTSRPVAHRGYHDAKAGRMENTVPAVTAAIDRGFAVEIDVQLTADGRVVVFHDHTLERLTLGEGKIAELQLTELRDARFRSGKAGMPTLEEVLDQVAGRTPLLIEIKTDWSGSGDLEAAVAEILATYDGAVAVMSFDHQAIVRIRQRSPGIVRGLISAVYDAAHFPGMPLWQRLAHRHLLLAATAMPQFVAYHIDALPASAPLLLRHATRMPLLTWTVRSPEDRARAAEWTDQVIFEGYDPDEA